MPFTVGSVDPGVGALSHRQSGTIVETKSKKNVEKTKHK